MVYQPGSVTAVLLSWKRVANVIRIVDEIIHSPDIAQVRIWNNNPELTLTPDDFPSIDRSVLAAKLWIHNSSQNERFLARYLACLDAPTELCFLQDDDYLIPPHVIHSLVRRLSEHADPSNHVIYLQSPTDHLYSHLCRIRSSSTSSDDPRHLHSSFAWLGYGALVPRSVIRQFVDLLRSGDFEEDERAMADNYFSLLRNVFPEIWIDKGHPLGQENAFTVGEEGDDRNWKYIQLAADKLQNILSSPNDLPSFVATPPPSATSRPSPPLNYLTAPVLSTQGVLFTNFLVLPAIFSNPTTVPLDTAPIDIRRIHDTRRLFMSAMDRDRYVQHSLSNVGDGMGGTYFQGAFYARKGEFIAYDALEPPAGTVNALRLVIGETSSALIEHLEVRTGKSPHFSLDDADSRPLKTTLAQGTTSTTSSGRVIECTFTLEEGEAFERVVAIVLKEDRFENVSWKVYEVSLASI